MSILKGANRTKADDATSAGSKILDPGVLGGKIRCLIDYYEMLGTEEALDTIAIGSRLPKGVRVVGATILTEDLADTCTLHLGDKEDPDRYVASLDGTTAGIARLGQALVNDSLAHKCDESVAATLDTDIIVTFATLAAVLNVGARVTVVIFYAQE